MNEVAQITITIRAIDGLRADVQDAPADALPPEEQRAILVRRGKYLGEVDLVTPDGRIYTMLAGQLVQAVWGMRNDDGDHT